MFAWARDAVVIAAVTVEYWHAMLKFRNWCGGVKYATWAE
jgi:hypothetical protein